MKFEDIVMKLRAPGRTLSESAFERFLQEFMQRVIDTPAMHIHDEMFASMEDLRGTVLERPQLSVVDGMLRYGPGEDHWILPQPGGFFVAGWPHKRNAHKYWLVDDHGRGYRLSWQPSTIEDFEATVELRVWSSSGTRPDDYEG